METKIISNATRKVQEEQELRIAIELERLRHDETVTEKRRQQLRETSVEVRELENKFKAAYVNKEITAQRTEKSLTTRTEKEVNCFIINWEFFFVYTSVRISIY